VANVATGEISHIPIDLPEPVGGFVLSPDAKELTFERAHGELYIRATRYVAPSIGGKPRLLDAGARSGGGTIFSVRKPGVFHEVWTSEGFEGKPRLLLSGKFWIRGMLPSPDGKRISFVKISPLGDVELHVLELVSGADRLLLDLAPSVKTLARGEAMTVQYRSNDGARLEGLLIKPTGFRHGERYPLFVDVHGGPRGGVLAVSLLPTGHPVGHLQYWANRGFVTFFPEYRTAGNIDAIERAKAEGRVAQRDAEDIMSGVDAAIASGFVDPQRMAVGGHSNGGGEVNFLITHTNRFRCAISSDGLTLAPSTFARGWSFEHRFVYLNSGEPWETPEIWARNSPLDNVGKVTTPTLFSTGIGGIGIHANAYMHTALVVRGVPRGFLMYEGESHVVNRNPANQRDLVERITAWVDRFCIGGG